MYHIAVLSDSVETGQRLVEQTKRLCIEGGLSPVVELYHDRERFFYGIGRQNMPSGVIVALPGVAGLNAVEHLRSLCPRCRLIWCSDLDFSLHAYRLRAEYFLLMPVTEAGLREALSVWMEQGSRERRQNLPV